MPNLGVPELIIIFLIVIVIFGVGRLPEIGGAIGKSIREFRDSSQGPKPTDEKASKDDSSEKNS
jgi:sec-independent protein translocase protein TatA